jgi:hypothetical protein
VAKKIDSQNHTPVERQDKLAYSTPFLIKHGVLRELTQSGTKGGKENINSGMTGPAFMA